MPITRPLGLTHLLPGEQSVSKAHASADTLESASAKTATQHFVLIFFMATCCTLIAQRSS
jgi:hypothetical protein